MGLFRLDSSIRQEGSVSRAVADSLEAGWREVHPGAEVVRRDLGADPLGASTWATALGAGQTPEDQRTAEQTAALAEVTASADQLANADAAVIATSLYNFGVSQHLKAWIDLLILDPRFGPGTQPLAGKSVALVVARGGGYGEGTPRAGWDHATPYLVRILGDVWGADVTVVAAELTLAEVNPAMAELIPLAKESAAAAHELATATGKSFGERVGASA
ncbi:NAD(P)H-dependent oxidoreductase [Actinokineospora sp. PR83]|uniref:FMN-dependent NADH-azoreductase n=1 Tax=Actinokineospora sp. PR83 TaxID=2884908 RepID=UPI001F26E86B|nr:NAD(P)H-dependent oxidoreductase [Actinokineospora sp. PR83]MCG8920746.1 NAD(P)H-dependent oxidoreductase [Actinokineospora sp. PR83]